LWLLSGLGWLCLAAGALRRVRIERALAGGRTTMLVGEALSTSFGVALVAEVMVLVLVITTLLYVPLSGLSEVLGIILFLGVGLGLILSFVWLLYTSRRLIPYLVIRKRLIIDAEGLRIVCRDKVEAEIRWEHRYKHWVQRTTIVSRSRHGSVSRRIVAFHGFEQADQPRIWIEVPVTDTAAYPMPDLEAPAGPRHRLTHPDSVRAFHQDPRVVALRHGGLQR